MIDIMFKATIIDIMFKAFRKDTEWTPSKKRHLLPTIPPLLSWEPQVLTSESCNMYLVRMGQCLSILLMRLCKGRGHKTLVLNCINSNLYFANCKSEKEGPAAVAQWLKCQPMDQEVTI